MSAQVLSFAFAALLAFAPEGGGSRMTLQGGSHAPAEFILDGALWRCAGGVCTAGPGGEDQRPDRACRRLVSRYGPVSDFAWQGRALTPDQVAACNRAAGK